jgi:hypothetical protein
MAEEDGKAAGAWPHGHAWVLFGWSSADLYGRFFWEKSIVCWFIQYICFERKVLQKKYHKFVGWVGIHFLWVFYFLNLLIKHTRISATANMYKNFNNCKGVQMWILWNVKFHIKFVSTKPLWKFYEFLRQFITIRSAKEVEYPCPLVTRNGTTTYQSKSAFFPIC